MKSYFSDRRVVIDIGSSRASKQATRVCLRVFDLGPACWNLMLDSLLSLLLIGNNLAAYAYDLLVVIEGDNRRGLENEGQDIANSIYKWCKDAKLELSVRKRYNT